VVSTDPRFAFGHSQLSREGLVAELLRQVGEPALLYLYDVPAKRLDPLIRRTCRRPWPELGPREFLGERESASPPSAAANRSVPECWPYCGDRQGV
jgi:hypothetical protein